LLGLSAAWKSGVSWGGVGGRALSRKRVVEGLAEWGFSTSSPFFQYGRKNWVVVPVVVVVTISVQVVVVSATTTGEAELW
jgi:hypothetical protein